MKCVLNHLRHLLRHHGRALGLEVDIARDLQLRLPMPFATLPSSFRASSAYAMDTESPYGLTRGSFGSSVMAANSGGLAASGLGGGIGGKRSGRGAENEDEQMTHETIAALRRPAPRFETIHRHRQRCAPRD